MKVGHRTVDWLVYSILHFAIRTEQSAFSMMTLETDLLDCV